MRAGPAAESLALRFRRYLDGVMSAGMARRPFLPDP